MTYGISHLMHQSASLQARVTAAAAGLPEIVIPDQWVRDQMWFLVIDPVWVTAWEGGLRQSDNTKYNPDIGARDDVVTDAAILTTVEARLAYLISLEPEPTPVIPGP